MENLKNIVAGFSGKKVLVFGDLMLDEHIWSRVQRISPEAPVPIADVTKISHVPGGCGNVAVNIAALGGTPLLIGLVGSDSSADKLRRALKAANVTDKYVITDKSRPTILKSRIIAGSQQVIRVDREDKKKLSPALIAKVLAQAKKILPLVDAIIISDYGKGMVCPETCQIIIKEAKRLKKFVAIDPKGQDYSKYRGASILTPNQKEAGLASQIKIKSEKELWQAGQKLLRNVKTHYILITRGHEGMSLFSRQGVVHIPAVPREVFDITGAGDTVIASLALAMARGAKIKQACAIANTAAAVVVGKIGTAPCSTQELSEAIEGHEPVTRKIKTKLELAKIIKTLREEEAKIVFTNGCFDILHLGHVRYLREAKKLGDVLIVGLNSDSSVKGLKGSSRPYTQELERAEVLASLEFIDYVVIFPEERPDNLIKIVRPDIHVKGGDYSINQLPEKKLVEKLDGKVIVIPPIKGKSTTNLVERILNKK